MNSHRLSTRRSIVWRSDLVRTELVFDAGSPPPEEWLKLVHSLGFDREVRNELPDTMASLTEELDRIRTRNQGAIAPVTVHTPEALPKACSWVPTLYTSPPWIVEEFERESTRVTSASAIEGHGTLDRAPPMRYLASWSQLRTRLQPLLQRPVLTRHLDEKKLTKLVSLRIPISRIPRKIRKRTPERLHVIADTTKRCNMLVYDQKMVIDRLSRELPQQNREFFRAMDPNFQNPYLNPNNYLKNKQSEDPATHVLILGDLGILDRSRRDEKQVWMRWVYQQWEQGKQIFVLVPHSLDLFPEWLKSIVHPIAWQGNEIRRIEGDTACAELLKKMFIYAYPAIRIELQLLRALRLMIPDADDASLESLFWQHPNLADNALLGAKNDRPSKENAFRHLFEELPDASRKMVLETIRSYRQDPTSITDWYLEFSNLSEDSRKLIEEYQNDTCGMIETIDRYRERLERGQLQLGDRDRLTWYATRASEDALNTQEVEKSIRFFREKLLPEKNRHRSTRMSEVSDDGKARHLVLQATFEGLECSPRMDPWESASIVAVGSTSRIVEVHVPKAELPAQKEISPERAFWKSGKKPDWVSAFGSDKYGLWCEFQVPRHDENGVVTQRMRWIKPGTFMMGSHASTTNLWWGDETQHEVTLTRGFWIADTPCTQGLWMGVGVSKNPSRFQGVNNPVEQVSWEDCEAWLKRLGDIHPQMQAALPSEAQWEYACRAGSTGAYCFGDSEEELEEYVWYQKNSGNTTHPVGKKLPNAWGLFDVHGNVWEWCEDVYREYTRTRAVDLVGPSKGSLRVIRGGGWLYPARYLRSACRYRYAPGVRNFNLGFRLLSSALGSEPSEFEYIFLQSIDLDAVGEITPEDQFSEIAVNAYTSIRVVSDQEGYQFDRLKKPDWAIDFGHDAYGLYSVFEVEPSKKGTPIRQRMRWIPPGQFLMGSPEGKDYSPGNEYPQHDVVITHGYWMFDTPCTQALWTALMGKNPSYFEDPARPVEQVSWEDAFGFAEKLNQWFAERNSKMRGKKILGWDELVFRLPTESEWEYACRAGTTGDTYGGDLKIEGDAKALLLDRICWYGGNSGHNYDLKKSLSLERDWLKDRQYPDKVGGTRKVATKTPNPWGLYDMLGNVWEWCEDWYGRYTADRATDPTGPSIGTLRVVRGGSWGYPARGLRSACRNGDAPGLRSDYLGFRLLSSAHQAKPTESGEGASRSEQREEAEGRGRDSIM